MTTILGACGWECGNTMMLVPDISGGNVVVSTTSKKTGSYALRIRSETNQWAKLAIGAAVANPSVSLWLMMDTTNAYNLNDSCRIEFLLSTGEYVGLRWYGPGHTFDAYVNGSKVADGTVSIGTNTWFHVQLYVVIDDAGTIGCKIDGHSSISYSGDTQPGAAATATYLYLRNYAYSFATFIYYDDVTWGYGGYLGVPKVYDKLVASDDTAGWTPSTGAVNYAMEDEVPPSDTDYNETAVDATTDKLGLAALSLTGLTPQCVIPWSRAWDPDAHGSSIQVGIDSGGSESYATSALAAAAQYYWGAADMVNPNGGGAWDQATIDALLHTKTSVIP